MFAMETSKEELECIGCHAVIMTGEKYIIYKDKGPFCEKCNIKEKKTFLVFTSLIISFIAWTLLAHYFLTLIIWLPISIALAIISFYFFAQLQFIRK